MLMLAVVLAACNGGGAADSGIPPDAVPTDVAGLPCPAPATSGWHSLTGTRFRDLGFTGANQGWLVGDNGSIARTNDGGVTWHAQSVPTNAPLLSAVFGDSDHGWAFGPQHALATTDGGQHWACAGFPPLASVVQVWLVKSGDIVVSGMDAAAQSKTFASSDGGAHWHATNFRVMSVTPHGSVLGVDANGSWGRSTDLGRTFVPQRSVTSTAPLMWMGGDATGAAWALVGAAGLSSPNSNWEVQTLYRSNDDGATWSRVADMPLDARVYELRVSADGSGWARFQQAQPRGMPSQNDVMSTTDGGLTWSRVLPPGATLPIGDHAQLVDARTMVVGIADVMLTSDGGKTWLPMVLPGVTDPSISLNSRIWRDAGGALVAMADNGRTFRSIDQGRSWAALDLPGASYGDAWQGIRDLWFTDTQHGLAVTFSSTLLQTEDGGRHWLARPGVLSQHSGNSAHGLQFSTPTTAWVLSDLGLLRSLDAGSGWAPAPLPMALANRQIGSMGFSGPQDGWLIPAVYSGGTDALFATRDGGLTWQERPSFQASVVDVLAFANANLVLHAPYTGGLRRSIDGGLNWTAIRPTSPAAAGGIALLHFADASHAWALVGGAHAYRSSDGGQTWQESDTLSARGRSAVFTDLKFADAMHGWIAGADGLLLATVDGGITWNRQATGTAQTLSKLFVLDADHAWAGGDRGGIFVTATGGR